MILHSNQDEFRQLVQASSGKLKIPQVFIEKDYWVTTIEEFEIEIKNENVLSKKFTLKATYFW